MELQIITFLLSFAAAICTTYNFVNKADRDQEDKIHLLAYRVHDIEGFLSANAKFRIKRKVSEFNLQDELDEDDSPNQS